MGTSVVESRKSHVGRCVDSAAVGSEEDREVRSADASVAVEVRDLGIGIPGGEQRGEVLTIDLVVTVEVTGNTALVVGSSL